MFTRSIFVLSISKFNRCSKDGFPLGSIYLARVLVCATLNVKSGEAEIRRLYRGNKLESNTAINASFRPVQFDFVVKSFRTCCKKAYK